MNKRKSDDKHILNFIAEAGMLKRVSRSGWSVVGIKDHESVADHSFRCAVIGYAISHMEGVPAYKALLMTLFNDIHEARITDFHKMAQRYIDADSAEDKAFEEQIEDLPKSMNNELAQLRREYRQQKTSESIIARDADILECLIQAKEYFEAGHTQAKKFMKKAPEFLKTKAAKSLWKSALKMTISDWWVSLSEFKR